MQTTPHTPAILFATGALLLLPGVIVADLTSSSRLTPLASDYLPLPAADESAETVLSAAEDPVVQLPPVVVEAAPLPGLPTEPTAAGRARAAEERYFTGATDTLNRFTLPLFGQDRTTLALARLAEDERLAKLNALDTTIESFAQADPAAADELRELRHGAFIRPSTF